MVGRNASQPRESWIIYRIGVNLGDVIVKARMSMATASTSPPALKVLPILDRSSFPAASTNRSNTSSFADIESLGDKQVKNITDPVRVYRVLPDPSALVDSRIRPLAAMPRCRHGCVVVRRGRSVLVLRDQASRSSDREPCSRPGASAGSRANPIATPRHRQKPPKAPPSETAKAPAITVTPPLSRSHPHANHANVTNRANAASRTQGAPATCGGRGTSRDHTASLAPKAKEPDMVPIAGGTFLMGSNEDLSERPIHRVSVKPFSISKTPITVREWNNCAEAKACTFTATGRDDAPITGRELERR